MNDKLEAIKQAAINKAWETASLRYKCFEDQLEIYDKNKAAIQNHVQLFCNNIHRQRGKTHVTSILAIEVALSKKKANIQFYAPTKSDLKDRVFKCFDKILEDCPEHLLPKFKTQDQSYVFPSTKSTITFHGVNSDRADQIRGGAIDLAIIDEAGFIDELDYLISSVVLPAFNHTDGSALITSTPPDSAAHPYIDVVKECRARGDFLELTILDSKRITATQLEKIKAGYPGGALNVEFRREHMAELVTNTEYAILKSWNDEFITDDYKLDDGSWTRNYKTQYYDWYHKLISIDYGTDDATAVNFYVFDFERALLIQEDELWLHGPTLTTKLLADEITRKRLELWGDIKPTRITCDSHDKFVTQTMNLVHNIHAIPVKKSTKQAMVNATNLLLGQNGFAVHPCCKMSILCYRDGVWERDGIGVEFSRSKYLAHYDSIDSLIYQVNHLGWIANDNPIPPGIGMNPLIKLYQLPTVDEQKGNGADKFKKTILTGNPAYAARATANKIIAGDRFR